MRITPVQPVSPIKPVVRRLQPYEGNDPAIFIHNNKTHRSVSEAFKDAEYACAITTYKTEWDRLKEYAVWIGMWVFVLFSFYALACWFEGAVK
jgi:hypothetical protein